MTPPRALCDTALGTRAHTRVSCSRALEPPEDAEPPTYYSGVHSAALPLELEPEAGDCDSPSGMRPEERATVQKIIEVWVAVRTSTGAIWPCVTCTPPWGGGGGGRRLCGRGGRPGAVRAAQGYPHKHGLDPTPWDMVKGTMGDGTVLMHHRNEVGGGGGVLGGLRECARVRLRYSARAAVGGGGQQRGRLFSDKSRRSSTQN